MTKNKVTTGCRDNQTKKKDVKNDPSSDHKKYIAKIGEIIKVFPSSIQTEQGISAAKGDNKTEKNPTNENNSNPNDSKFTIQCKRNYNVRKLRNILVKIKQKIKDENEEKEKKDVGEEKKKEDEEEEKKKKNEEEEKKKKNEEEEKKKKNEEEEKKKKNEEEEKKKKNEEEEKKKKDEEEEKKKKDEEAKKKKKYEDEDKRRKDQKKLYCESLRKIPININEIFKITEDTENFALILNEYVHDTLLLIRFNYPYEKKLMESDEIRCQNCLQSLKVYEYGNINSIEECLDHDVSSGTQKKRKICTCCKKPISSLACEESTKQWKLYKNSLNNKFDDFYVTNKSSDNKNYYNIFGIDCGMILTIKGKKLSNVAVVDITGKTVYSEWVKVPGKIIRNDDILVSSETVKNIEEAKKSYKEVRQDLINLITAETILIGHGLENDLKILKIIHYRCIDTAILLGHLSGLPRRYKIKDLISSVFNNEIQIERHYSEVDAKSAIELVLYRLYFDGFNCEVIKKFGEMKSEMISKLEKERSLQIEPTNYYFFDYLSEFLENENKSPENNLKQ